LTSATIQELATSMRLARTPMVAMNVFATMDTLAMDDFALVS